MITEKEQSKYLSYILRHKPEFVGIILDKDGWTNIEDLIARSSDKWKLDLAYIFRSIFESNVILTLL